MCTLWLLFGSGGFMSGAEKGQQSLSERPKSDSGCGGCWRAPLLGVAVRALWKLDVWNWAPNVRDVSDWLRFLAFRFPRSLSEGSPHPDEDTEESTARERLSLILTGRSRYSMKLVVFIIDLPIFKYRLLWNLIAAELSLSATATCSSAWLSQKSHVTTGGCPHKEKNTRYCEARWLFLSSIAFTFTQPLG